MWWQDTILIPPAASDDDSGYVIICHRFITFTGEFVLHCHILGHEDRGMMQNVAVYAAEADCPAESKWQDKLMIEACPDNGVPNDLVPLDGSTPPDWNCEYVYGNS